MRNQGFFGRTGLALAAAGIVAFAAFLVLLGFGDQWRSGRDGGAHALSISGNGYAGISRLLAAGGGAGLTARDMVAVAGAPLLVVTPPDGADGGAVAEIVQKRQGKPTLIVLDKWLTMPDPKRKGWVRAVSARGSSEETALADLGKFKIEARNAVRSERLVWAERGLSWPAPGKLQTVRSQDLTPLITARGGIVLGRLKNAPVYVLAEPDLINNSALKSWDGAGRAVTLFDQLPETRAAVFDVTLNGYSRSPNLMRLAFTPPFLAVTLCLLVAAALAVLHAATRFGPALRQPRAHAFGAQALIDNAADLVVQARAETVFGERYLAMLGPGKAGIAYNMGSGTVLRAAQDAWDRKVGA